MVKDSSFKKVNYYLRPNKQVERKIMIDILQNCRNEIKGISNYCYVGMGSIYYYDFILMHKMLGINTLKSIDDKTSVKRFKFNKPYEFVDFENCLTTDYLIKHDWDKSKTIVWLDYDEKFDKADYVPSDLSILGKYCCKNDFVFITIDASVPNGSRDKVAFLKKYKKYISPKYNDLTYTQQDGFSLMLQNIFLNIIKERNEYNDYKFQKICSFVYRDGAPMYTLGGVFSDDLALGEKIRKLHDSVNLNEDMLQHINIPKITYKEKFYLDGKINSLGRWLKYYAKKVEKLGLRTQQEKEEKLQEFIDNRMAFELLPSEISNYVKNYKYFPQYYEGII